MRLSATLSNVALAVSLLTVGCGAAQVEANLTPITSIAPSERARVRSYSAIRVYDKTVPAGIRKIEGDQILVREGHHHVVVGRIHVPRAACSSARPNRAAVYEALQRVAFAAGANAVVFADSALGDDYVSKRCKRANKRGRVGSGWAVILKNTQDKAYAFECPDGAQLKGAPPPTGTEQQCVLPDGTPHGLFIRWRSKNVRLAEGEYVNGKKHGRWRIQHSETVDRVEVYRHGTKLSESQQARPPQMAGDTVHAASAVPSAVSGGEMGGPDYGAEGTTEVGGTFGLSLESLSVDDQDASRTTIAISPTVSYFVAKNVMLTAAALLSTSTTGSDASSDDTTAARTAFLGGVGYLFPGATARFGPQLLIGYSRYSVSAGSDELTDSGLVVQGRLNVKIPIRGVAIAQIGAVFEYSPRDFEVNGGSAADGTATTIGVDFGLFVYF